MWGHTNEYTVVSHDGKHPTQVIEKRRWTSPVTTRAERRMWQDITRYFETRGYTNDTPIPDRKPAFRYLRVDLDGRIFVARYVAAQKADVSPEDDEDGWKPMEWVEPESFDVFSSGGTYLGALSLPIGERFAQARGDALWTIGRGEYDVPFVAEYRLTR